MFERLTQKIADTMGKSVKETVQPIKTEMTKKVDNKVDLYSRILKLGVLIFLFIEGTKRVTNSENKENHSGPSNIVINNYIQERRKEEKD